MAVFSRVWNGAWPVDTNGVDGTKVLAASFIFLAYFLHPVMAVVFQRVRAHRAWQAIEHDQTVEVTKYSLAEEVFRGRGKWDAARIITVLLAFFSLATCGLELSLDLAYVEGDADTLNRPPPVVFVNDSDSGDTAHWQVIPKADFDCEDKGCRSLSNVYEGYAESMYDVLGNSTCGHGPVKGRIRVASWSLVPEESPALLYYLGGDSPTVKGIQCVDNTQPSMMEMYHGDDVWGSVVECMNGPELSSVRDQSANNAIVSPPTILLTRSSDEKVYLIVEETSINPSFLYSVWTAGRTYDGHTELHHEFHIAATTRLVEAVVTAVVHGEESGQYSLQMVRMWSECGERCDSKLRRARPFGEHHTNDPVRVETLETIECGFESNADAFLCLLYLISLAAVGIAMSLCLRGSTGIDVYDRDELFRAVSTPGENNLTIPSSRIRMFVQKEDTGHLSVVVRDKTNEQPVHPRIIRTGVGNREEDVESGPIEDEVSSSMRISGRSSRLEGSQTSLAPEQQSSTAKQVWEWTGNSPTVVAQSFPATPSMSGELTITPVHDRGAHDDTDIAFPGSTWGRAASTFFSRSLSGRRA